MNQVADRLRSLVLAAVLALVIAGFASLLWGSLVVANLHFGPAIPWAFVAMAALLWLLFRYLNGSWWPSRTQSARRRLLRAKPVPQRVLVWALLAGGLALAALVGLWILLVELTGVGGNPTIPSSSTAPPLTIAVLLVMGSLVSSITEEFAFRGYAQVTLERVFPAFAAVVASSVFFMLWHGPTQGFSWSKLLFFFLVGVTFGSIAFVTRSILPALPVHLVGDLLFFFAIWPYDAGRPNVLREGPSAAFWLWMVEFVLFAILALLAFGQLAQASGTPAPRVSESASAMPGTEHVLP
jgi:membrane protease YdiL (CAAX protease family)